MSDEEYKDLLDSWEEQPPQHVWNAIEKAIQTPAAPGLPARPWYAGAWLGVAILSIIGVSAFLVYRANKTVLPDNHKTEVQQANEQKPPVVMPANPENHNANSTPQVNTTQPEAQSADGNGQNHGGSVKQEKTHTETHPQSEANTDVETTNHSDHPDRDNNHPSVQQTYVLKLKLSNNTTCEGKAITVKLSGAAPGEIIEFGDGHFVNVNSTTVNLPYLYAYAGTYTVSVKQGNDILASQSITVTPRPVAGFSAVISENTQIRFVNISTHADKFIWIFGDGAMFQQTGGNSVDHIYQSRSRKQFHVKLIALNSISFCSDTFEQDVKNPNYVNYFSTPIPNVFTPNNDGINDVFEIPAAELSKWHLIIADMNGNKVYETDRQKNYWNGRVNNNGAECAEGIYRYYIYYMQPDDTEEHQKSGTINLSR
jgi:gliding motility-associated-like protein